MPHNILVYLRTKISKVANRDKLNLKREVFIAWTQPQVLSAYFKQIENAKRQLAKWNVSMSGNNIVIHVVDQIYESDCFSEEMMTKWEETNENTKTWCQELFEEAYITCK